MVHLLKKLFWLYVRDIKRKCLKQCWGSSQQHSRIFYYLSPELHNFFNQEAPDVVNFKRTMGT